ncbi:hypothetical protein QE152_g38095 [Popillia japonica]|uniref:Uncharacterized protein n=1 Tax=Popillia japonica TaxID=7064 RepID=A0AAW1I847_POPJA
MLENLNSPPTHVVEDLGQQEKAIADALQQTESVNDGQSLDEIPVAKKFWEEHPKSETRIKIQNQIEKISPPTHVVEDLGQQEEAIVDAFEQTESV